MFGLCSASRNFPENRMATGPYRNFFTRTSRRGNGAGTAQIRWAGEPARPVTKNSATEATEIVAAPGPLLALALIRGRSPKRRRPDAPIHVPGDPDRSRACDGRRLHHLDRL